MPRSRRPSAYSLASSHGSSYSRRGSSKAHLYDSDSAPSAPPLEAMDQVSGYESISFDAVNIPPPPGSQTCKTAADKTEQPLPFDEERVTEKQARSALMAFAKKHFCYGTAVPKDMAVTLLKYSSAFHYELETFTEKRETSWTYAPYHGGVIDGPENGSAPLPWSIEVTPTNPFEDEIKVVQVPHTASVKTCHRCHAAGNLPCNECNSKGWVRCISCNGSSYNTDASGNKERCFYCYTTTYGRGRQDCCKCDTTGKLNCPTCDGTGHLLCYIQLTVTWKVNSSEHLVDCDAVPEALIRGASGKVAFDHEGEAIAPIKHFPDETINMASAQLLQQHKRMFKDQHVLSQRHQVRIIPVTTVRYEWKYHRGFYYIYGEEHKVFCPDYPQKCCCGCTLM
ncbi:hypothetical protein R5R35_012599 [Gryllus longicercus]|uniref:Protein SSUH2 homolog n=1 Tax=Gryllus longicercus TaxID=2509291 RepID=A0AAN9VDP9_9ORTH